MPMMLSTTRLNSNGCVFKPETTSSATCPAACTVDVGNGRSSLRCSSGIFSIAPRTAAQCACHSIEIVGVDARCENLLRLAEIFIPRLRRLMTAVEQITKQHAVHDHKGE